MQNIPIQAIPNQQFSVVLDNNRWDFTLKSTDGTISASVVRNGEVIVTNARAVSGMRILPAIYQEAGNFAIIAQNELILDYTQFGVTQFMLYLSAAELEEIRNTNPAQIVPEFFDPLAPLPLRFEPKGYVLA
jgi:hypothetical protein